jgi:hypothetical protein
MNNRILIAFIAVVSLLGYQSAAAVVLGTATMTDGSDNQVDVSFTDGTSPVGIDEFTTVAGSNTILGAVKVFGDDAGFFSLGAFGQSNHDHVTSFSFTDTITNTNTSAQSVTLDFLINAGQLETKALEIPPQGSEFQEAGFNISISFDGTVLFESSATLRQTPGSVGTTNAAVTQNGVDLGGVLTNPFIEAPSTWLYTWDDFVGSLDLGVLGAGASGVLQYDVSTFVSAEYDMCGSLGCGQTRARIGDPFGASGDPLDPGSLSSIGGPDTIIFTDVVPATPVDEPGMIALLLMGAGLIILRRRLRLV